MSSWNKNDIREKRKAALLELNLTPEQLLERCAELETALYPFAYVLGSLNDKAWRGTTASSMLFPMFSDNEQFLVYKDKTSVEVQINTVDESKLHELGYYTEDSIHITDGSKLDDKFEILAVHQQEVATYVSCGNITMSDVRHAMSLIFPPKIETEAKSEN